jgi:hypothetical protein
MSAAFSIFLAILMIGLLAGLVLFVLNRLLNGDSLADEPSETHLHGTIGSYGDLRQQLVETTPEAVPRPPISLTANNVVFLVEGLEGEVNNGGFDQFFFNSTGNYSLETVRALELINANKTAAILREACDRFPGSMPPTDILARREIMLSTVSPDAGAFEELDARFYAYEDNLSQLMDDFRRVTVDD